MFGNKKQNNTLDEALSLLFDKVSFLEVSVSDLNRKIEFLTSVPKPIVGDKIDGNLIISVELDKQPLMIGAAMQKSCNHSFFTR